jgi:hypothetical protein
VNNRLPNSARLGEDKSMLTKIKRMRKNTKFIIFCITLTGFFLMIGLMADTGYAQGRYYREEWKLPDFYPRGFDGYGVIDRITNDEVVIGDSYFKLSYNVKYNTPRKRNTSNYHFNLGRSVAYLLNKDQEIESLWLIK